MRSLGKGASLPILAVFGLILSFTSRSIAARMECQGPVIRHVKNGVQKGSYSVSLDFRLPTGGGDRRAGGEGNLRLTRDATNQSANLKLKCQADSGLPGALICSSPNMENPFKSPVILELYPAREGKPQMIQLFIGAWDSRPSARAALGQSCK